MARKRTPPILPTALGYDTLLSGIAFLLEDARRATTRAINSLLTATYYEIGRRIVEFEQGGKARAEYGEELIYQLGKDLSQRFGRGFSGRNLLYMRSFYLGWEILQTVSAKLEARVRGETGFADKADSIGPATLAPLLALATAFPLPWSHYVRLMTVKDAFIRAFYEDEAIRGGWSVRQLNRQIATQFCERLAAAKNKESFLAKGRVGKPEDMVTVEELVRDPYLLEVRHANREGIADPVSRTLGRRCLSQPTYLQSKDDREHSLLVKRRLTTKCPDHAPQGLRSMVKATLLELQFHRTSGSPVGRAFDDDADRSGCLNRARPDSQRSG